MDLMASGSGPILWRRFVLSHQGTPLDSRMSDTHDQLEGGRKMSKVVVAALCVVLVGSWHSDAAGAISSRAPLKEEVRCGATSVGTACHLGAVSASVWDRVIRASSLPTHTAPCESEGKPAVAVFHQTRP